LNGSHARPIPDDDIAPDALVNGIDPRTGKYAVQPIAARILSAIAEGRPLSQEELDEITDALHRRQAHLGVGYDIDDNALDQCGWAVIFAANDPRVDDKKARLARLLERRREEAGALYREFVGAEGWQPGEQGRKFLNRHGAAAGPVPVRKVPYYLLLAGSATEIPFDVQCALDSRHAVGRLDFDALDDLERYAERLVATEKAAGPAPRRAAFFATSNPADVNTHRSAKRLARPLAETLTSKRDTWAVDQRLQKDATKSALKELLTGPAPPSLLFTATHGLLCAKDDAMQRERQGALVTQEWPGPATDDREMTPNEYFAASDLTGPVDLRGMLAFLFACFGGGTPRHDEFLTIPGTPPIELAPAPFVSRLGQRMLTVGANAVVGHVDRAWSCSFLWPGAGAQIGAFEDVMLKLVDGWRVGAAVNVLHSRCNEISFELAAALKERRFGLQNDEDVAGLWLAQTDAANYVVLGDPAARLLVRP
jgi:hypothetical protein